MKITKFLEQNPVFSIQAAYERILPSVNKGLKKEEVNLLQGLVLTALFFEDKKEVKPSQLAEVFQTTRGNMSHILSHLEYKGWVRRTVHPKDARQFQIELKPDGRKKALALIKFFDRLQGGFEKELGPAQCQKAVDGLRRLTEAYGV
jgi:DNA-binding MarR family transcriptional regulator